MAIERKDENLSVDYGATYDVTINTSTVEYGITGDDIHELWFIEDIFSFCMRGKLVFVDRVGLFEFGGMSGTETIRIIYGDGNNKKVQSFFAHETKLTPINNEEIRVEISLVSDQFKMLNYHTYSLSYNTYTYYTEIVQDIAEKFLGIDDYEQEEESIESIPYFDTSNGTPAENIKWLLRRCRGSNTKTAGYLFYQNTTERQWNMVTLESLLSQTKNMWITEKDEKYRQGDVGVQYINKIHSYRIKGVDNKDLPELSRGYMLGYDPELKKFYHKVYTYLDAIKKYTILGQHTLFENIQILPYLVSEADPINTGETDPQIIENLWFSNWIRKYCGQQLVEVSVRGHENRYAGGVIDVLWDSLNGTDEKINQSMNGKYLIKSITHNFSNENQLRYEQSMVLIKNGYGNKQEGNFIQAVNKNL